MTEKIKDSLKLFAFGDYGGIELRAFYQKYLTTGLMIAVGFHMFGIGAYWGSIYLSEEEEPVGVVRIVKYSELGPPPSITSTAAPAIAVSGQAVKPSVGIPVPVPDAEVSPEQTIATQTEMSQAVSPVSEGAAAGGAVIEQDIRIEDEPPADFVPYEKEPAIVTRVEPKYPDLATRAGIEGTVHLKIWVDKEGKVRKAVVVKSDADILNQPAIDAAVQWTFTPAIQHDKPVAVWVVIPFRFTLRGRN
jgi:protein TonB